MTDAVGFECAAVIATADRPDWLRACLRSLAEARPAFREVVVADQSEGTGARAEVEAHGARYLHLDRRGLSRARNAALAIAGAEWLYFPDDDCTVAPDLLAAAARGLARHPETGVLCARIETPGGRPIMAGMGADERLLATPAEVLRTVMSPGLFVHRRVIERVGGFDEAFGVGARFPSGEESDLLFRALRAGERGLYLPEARVFHPDQFAIRDPAAQRRRAHEYGRGWGALFAKHGSGPGAEAYLALHRHYLTRAAGGLAIAALTGRVGLARRYAASLAGRRRGFAEYLAEAGRE